MRTAALAVALMLGFGGAATANAQYVRLKDVGHFQGWRDNPLVGYGIVAGLAGSGDSSRNEVTRQALKNVLARMGAAVDQNQIQSRNVAVVLVTATLPPSANVGDRLDVTVTSIGDARSLAGGSLMMTPLLGPDQRTYALAQGALVVGGYRFEADRNLRQKNYPTVGQLPNGATVEVSISANLKTEPDWLVFNLSNPDFTTAENAAAAINVALGRDVARVQSADAIYVWRKDWTGSFNNLVARIENVVILPDQPARIVINERTGTLIAGGNVQISNVVIVQEDIKVSVSIDRTASQPNVYGGYVPNARSLVVTNTRLDVDEGGAVIQNSGTTVSDLLQALKQSRVPTRTIIAILQGMKAAGALHAQLIVQ